jgi:CheY-like chemotaxis protein
VSNAAKFTEHEGRIEVTLDEQDSEALLRVRDTGIGIEPRLLPYIFDLFTQAEQGLDRAQGGLGIGLTVARSLVEMHGGTIEAHSAGKGHGAEFVVRLPLTAPVSREEDGAQPSPGERRTAGQTRVVIVDDNRDAADSLADLASLWGYAARPVYDGEQALRVVAEEVPNAIVLDIGMPGMNGYDVARRLRSLPGGKEALLVALTGYATEEDRRRSHEAGFDHHLVKPPDPDELRALLEDARAEHVIPDVIT